MEQGRRSPTGEIFLRKLIRKAPPALRTFISLEKRLFRLGHYGQLGAVSLERTALEAFSAAFNKSERGNLAVRWARRDDGDAPWAPISCRNTGTTALALRASLVTIALHEEHENAARRWGGVFVAMTEHVSEPLCEILHIQKE